MIVRFKCLYLLLFLSASGQVSAQSYQEDFFPLYRGLFGAAAMYRAPVGSFGDVIEPGVGLGLQFHFNPMLFNGLLFNLNMGISDHSVNNSENSRFLLGTAALGPVYDLPVFSNKELLFGAGVGLQYTRLQLAKTNISVSKVLPYFEGNVRFNAPVGNSIFLFAQGGYSLAIDSDSQDLQQNQSLLAGISYRYDPNNFQAKAASLLKLNRWEPKRIFSAKYAVYGDTGAGTLSVVNESDEVITNVRVLVNVPGYGNEKELIRLKSLSPGGNASGDIYLSLNAEILELTGNREIEAELKLSYEIDGDEQSLVQSVNIPAYGRNSLSWVDLANTGSFVTHTDPAVAKFARESMRAFNKDKEAGIPPRVAQAMYLFNALGEAQISYVSDPDNAFAGKESGEVIDTVYFPRETLVRKTGDCDDLTVLTAAMFENVGIEAAAVAVPGHIFLLFDTEIPVAQLRGLPFSKDSFVPLKGTLWIPIEATSIGNDFMAAWEEGAREIRKWENHEETEILTFRAAWSNNPPAKVEGTITPVPALEKNIFAKADNPLLVASINKWQDVAYRKPLKTLEKANIEAPSLRNKLQIGILHGTFAKYEQAEESFAEIMEEEPGYAPAIVNMGNLRFMQRNYAEAVSYYEQAGELLPGSAELKINLARAYYEEKKYDKAKDQYSAAVEIVPALKNQFSYLSGEVQQGRAADPTQFAQPIWLAD